MASFGEDVSMDDFRPPQANENAEGGAGHTSDGSVLNVQIPAIAPRSEPAMMGVGGAGAGAFGPGVVSSRRDKVLRVLPADVCLVARISFVRAGR